MAKIALIHAVQVAMEPVQQAFEKLWPEAELVNILDESLSAERAKTEQLTPALYKRVADLTEMAIEIKADAVLFTCSAFGEAIDEIAVRVNIPVLKPNEAMFKKALAKADSIAMVATFQPAVEGMEEEFRTMAQQEGKDTSITTVCDPLAKAALNKGDTETHNNRIAELAGTLETEQVIMLAHFSTSVAKDAVEARTGKSVLTSPDSAVEMLRELVQS